MAETNLLSSKIVSFPKPGEAWSQAYNAGKLFAVLSLNSKEPKEQEKLDLLSQVGRGVLDKLEEEFFTIETKNLSTIKQAIEKALEKIPGEIVPSFGAAVFSNDVLYLVGNGGSKVFIKRGEKFGTILDSENQDLKAIASSSGPLENNGLIILVTKSFLDIIDPQSLFSSLNNLSPNEIAEKLTPNVHEKEEGTAAAFIIKYIKQGQETQELSYPKEQKKEESPKEEDKKESAFSIKDRLATNFSHSKKVYLTIAVVLLTILFSSMFFATKKQDNAKTEALFKEIYTTALEKYDEGSDLLGLNANLAKENLLASKELLEENKNKFKEKSKEQEQITSLLNKVNEGLEKLDQDISFFLKTQINLSTDGRKASFFAQDENFVYILDNNGISSLDKKTGQTKMLIKSESWKTPTGIAAYLGNLYVIDKDLNQILKFVDEGGRFTKSNYFDSAPNLSNAVSMSIDGSIWILFKDGSIQKFIRGTRDTFNVSGLNKPLANPRKIYTDRDTDTLYILDNDNSRVVVIEKDGKYLSEYSHDAIKTAKDFEVLESSNKIYVLSESKIYEIGIK